MQRIFQTYYLQLEYLKTNDKWLYCYVEEGAIGAPRFTYFLIWYLTLIYALRGLVATKYVCKVHLLKEQTSVVAWVILPSIC